MGSNSDWDVDPQSLLLPFTAGPSDPRILLGPDIPPELIIWGAAQVPPVTFNVVIVFYSTANKYMWLGMVTILGTTVWYQGTYDPTNNVEIVAFIGNFGAPFNQYNIGSISYPGSNIGIFRSNVDTTLTKSLSLAGLGDQTSGGADFTAGVGSTSQGRGFVTRAELGGGSVGPFAAETVILTTPANFPQNTFATGRVFSFMVGIQMSATAIGRVTLRIRLGSTTAGTLLATIFEYMPVAATAIWHNYQVFIRNTSGANVTNNLVLTAQPAAGNLTVSSGTDTQTHMTAFDWAGFDATYWNNTAGM